jgi:hypothetical protein
MRFWLGVVQREHVQRAVALGIAQINHGSPAIKRLHPGDGLVYYSPKTTYPDGDPLREFTAVGIVSDGEAWQADDGEWQPWRRRVEYDESARPLSITPLLEVLDLTRGNRNWGYQLRRGLLDMSPHDFGLIAGQMGATSLVP